MAKFVKGDVVQVTPNIDWRWDQWSSDHSQLCSKICNIVDIKYESWTNQTFVEVSYRGKRVWFLDHHLIVVDDYEEIYFESIHRACEELQRHERICKKLRDEILSDVFTPEEYKSSRNEVDVQKEKSDDEFFKDWEEVTTKEVIPLPGNGGTMTTPKDPDPKAQASTHRKKVRKIKNLGSKKIIKKDASKNLTDSWTLSDEEIQELEDYLDTLPYSNTPDQSGDYDYEYDEFD